MNGVSTHEVGQRRCLECWSGYPQKCRCGGLIHAQFLRENWQGELALDIFCDKCGPKYRFRSDRRQKKR